MLLLQWVFKWLNSYHKTCTVLAVIWIFTWSAWISIMKAFLLQDMSCSPSRNLAISSGASGIRESWFLFIINKCHNLLTWNYAIILTQTQYTFILIIKQTSHDWDGDHLKGPWLKAFRGSRSDLNLWLGNTVQDQCKSFYQRDSVGEVCARLDREEKIWFTQVTLDRHTVHYWTPA